MALPAEPDRQPRVVTSIRHLLVVALVVAVVGVAASALDVPHVVRYLLNAGVAGLGSLAVMRRWNRAWERWRAANLPALAEEATSVGVPPQQAPPDGV